VGAFLQFLFFYPELACAELDSVIQGLIPFSFKFICHLERSRKVSFYKLKIFIMPTSIITTDDLREFKEELLEDIKAMINHQSGFAPKKWLKSPEVRDLLSISPGTLQNLRINGTLPYTKVGGVIYYDYEEITKVLEENRVHNKF
jgi:uncharacterized protein YfkK (UPF0435 family)